jgi:hypothetical protein
MLNLAALPRGRQQAVESMPLMPGDGHRRESTRPARRAATVTLRDARLGSPRLVTAHNADSVRDDDQLSMVCGAYRSSSSAYRS